MTIDLKSPAEIDAMREAGRVVARCLEAVRRASAPGVTLEELDTAAHDVMREHGATPAFLDYHPHFAPSPYPGVICSSVNDAVVHAIPGGYRLADGDLQGDARDGLDRVDLALEHRPGRNRILAHHVSDLE